MKVKKVKDLLKRSVVLSLTVGSIATMTAFNVANAESYAAGGGTVAVTDGIAIGTASLVNALSSISIGNSAQTQGTTAIALGNLAVGLNTGTVAIGSSANAMATESVAIGTLTQATGPNTVVLGHQSKAQDANAVSIGYNALAQEENSIAIGTTASTTAAGSMALGNIASASGVDSIALGTGSTASALKSVAFGQAAIANADNSVALGTGAAVTHQNSVALGANSLTSEIHSGVDATKYSFTLGNNLVEEAYAGNSSTGTVSFGSVGNERQLQNVGSGEISSTSTDAVNGSQLFQTNKSVQSIADKIGVVNTTDNGVSESNTVGENIDALNNAIATTSGSVGALNNQVELNSSRLNDLGSAVGELDSRVNKVGAASAALASLHPLDFDPDDKWDFAAGYGHYKNANSAAVGVFYRPDEDTMFSVGTTFGSENMINAGISLKVGRGNHVSTSRVAMAKELIDLRNQVKELTALVKGGFGTGLTDQTIQFPDIPENHWAYDMVSKLAGNGIVEGYPDGNYKGDRSMTRYEMAAMIYRAMSKGAQVDGKLLNEFKSELARISVDGTKIQRVHVIK